MPIREEIVITADNKTSRAFREVQRASRKTADDIADMSRKMAGLTVVGAAAAAGLFLLTKRAIENADAIGKTADKVGVGVESLQELRFAAEQAGVSAETLDMALQRFSRRVGEAVQGGGELKETLEQYQIALTDSEGNTRAIIDILGDYAEAVQNAESQQEQLRLSFKGFDSEGAALVNLLRQGREGMDALRQEARNLGIVLDEDAVRGAERASDALNRMEKIVSVNLQRVLVELAPTIESLAVAFSDAAPKILEFTNNIIAMVFGIEALSLDGLKQELRELDEAEKERLKTHEARGATHIGAIRWNDEQIAKYEQERAKLLELIATKEKEIEARKAAFEISQTGGANVVDKTVEQEQKRAAAWIEQINETYDRVSLTEEALLALQFERDLAKLDELHANKLIKEDEFLEARGALYSTYYANQIELEEDFGREVARIDEQRKRDAESTAKFLASVEKSRLREMQGTLGDIAGLMASHSRTAFEVGKAAAIANTIISTIVSAQRAYEAFSWFPPLAAAMAALAAGAGFARVQAIKSTSFNGGGGIHHGGGGGGSVPATIPTQDIPLLPPTQQQPAARELNLTIVGHSITAEQMRDEFIPLFNEAAEDGVPIKINATVANS